MRAIVLAVSLFVSVLTLADQPCFQVLVDFPARAASDDGSVLVTESDPNLVFWTEWHGTTYRVRPTNSVNLFVSEDGSTVWAGSRGPHGGPAWFWQGRPLVFQGELNTFDFREGVFRCVLSAVSADGLHAAGTGLRSAGISETFGCGWFDRRSIIYVSAQEDFNGPLPIKMNAISDNGRLVAGQIDGQAAFWNRDQEFRIGDGVATACNDDGVVAGTAPDGAWRWEHGIREIILPSAVANDAPIDISDDGQCIALGGRVWDAHRGIRTVAEILDDLLLIVDQSGSLGLLGVSDDGQTLVGTVDLPGFGEGFTFRLRLGTTCAGDLNEDGNVGLDDLATLLAEFGGPGIADFDCDGHTGLLELGTLLNNFGETCP